MKIVITMVCVVLVINLAWLIIFGIRDHLKRADNGEISTNLSIATRNIKGCCINVILAIIVMVCGRILNLPW